MHTPKCGCSWEDPYSKLKAPSTRVAVINRQGPGEMFGPPSDHLCNWWRRRSGRNVKPKSCSESLHLVVASSALNTNKVVNNKLNEDDRDAGGSNNHCPTDTLKSHVCRLLNLSTTCTTTTAQITFLRLRNPVNMEKCSFSRLSRMLHVPAFTDGR